MGFMHFIFTQPKVSLKPTHLLKSTTSGFQMSPIGTSIVLMPLYSTGFQTKP